MGGISKDIKQGKGKFYAFEDVSLSNDIFRSDCKMLPMSIIPRDTSPFVITIPEHIKIPVEKDRDLSLYDSSSCKDKSDMMFDTFVWSSIREQNLGSMSPSPLLLLHKMARVDRVMMCVAFDSRSPRYYVYDVLFYSDGHVLDGRVVYTPEGKAAEVNNAIYILPSVINYLLFVNSIGAKMTSIQRKPAKMLCEKKRRLWTPMFNLVEIKRSYKKVEYDDDTPSGRTVSVRFAVRGHFRHYTKKRTEPKVVWVVPHLKGPATAPFKGKDYVIPKEEVSRER
jgi:hypothetical protein